MGYEVCVVFSCCSKMTFFNMKQIDCGDHKRVYNNYRNRHRMIGFEVFFRKTIHIQVAFADLASIKKHSNITGFYTQPQDESTSNLQKISALPHTNF